MLLTRHHLRFKGAPLSICVCTAKHVCLSSPCVALRLEAHTASAACPAHPGNLDMISMTVAAVICDADDPCSVNTA